MQNLIITSLLAVMGLALIGRAASIVREAIKEHLARRAWEKRIKANRDDIFRDIERRA